MSQLKNAAKRGLQLFPQGVQRLVVVRRFALRIARVCDRHYSGIDLFPVVVTHLGVMFVQTIINKRQRRYHAVIILRLYAVEQKLARFSKCP